MRRRWLALGLVALLVAAAGPALAHGWAVHADAQVVGDDAVVLEHVSMLEPRTVAVHLLEDGDLGPVVGVHEFEAQGEYSGVRVDLDREAWDGVDGPARLAAVVHETDGDATFEWPGDDGVYRPDDPVEARFAVEKTDGESARVLAVRQSTGGNVTILAADLPADGFVVLYEEVGDGERGAVVGVRRLAAGHHEAVAVPVAPRFYNDADGRLYMVAALARDDGDGTFEPGEDALVTVDGSPVTTAFDAEKTRPTVPTPSPTATPSPTGTPTLTATPSPTATPTTTPLPSVGGGTPTPASGPGFGVGLAVTALVLAALARRR